MKDVIFVAASVGRMATSMITTNVASSTCSAEPKMAERLGNSSPKSTAMKEKKARAAARKEQGLDTSICAYDSDDDAH